MSNSADRWGSFLLLPENRSAVRALRAVARALTTGRRPAVVPVVLHGPTGVGKSLLVSTLVDEAAAAGAATARIVSAGDLARTAGEGDGFADPDLTSCDLLVIEDVQRLPAREAGAVAGLIDRRAARRRAVLVTANVGPAALGHLPAGFTSRLTAGLVVGLDSPGPASRRAVLADAAAARGVRLTDAALDGLAAPPTGGGFRPVLGALGNLAAADHPGPLDRAAVDAVLAGTGQPTGGVDVAAVVGRVAAAFGITPKELMGRSRLRRVLVPRQVAMYLTRAVCGLSLPRLGAAFGRDHATVLHSCRKVESDIGTDARLSGVVRQLRAELG